MNSIRQVQRLVTYLGGSSVGCWFGSSLDLPTGRSLASSSGTSSSSISTLPCNQLRENNKIRYLINKFASMASAWCLSKITTHLFWTYYHYLYNKLWNYFSKKASTRCADRTTLSLPLDRSIKHGGHRVKFLGWREKFPGWQAQFRLPF